MRATPFALAQYCTSMSVICTDYAVLFRWVGLGVGTGCFLEVQQSGLLEEAVVEPGCSAPENLLPDARTVHGGGGRGHW